MTTALNGEQNDHSNLALPNRDRLRGRPANRNSRYDGDVMSTEYDYPEFHEQGMGCGLEDRNITDRYEAMQYGWDEAASRFTQEVVAPMNDEITRLQAEVEWLNLVNRGQFKAIDRIHCMYGKRLLELTGEPQTVLIPDEEFVKYFEEIKALKSELTKAREFDPCNWTDRQVLDFLGIALRNVDLVGEVHLSEIRQGFEHMRARQSTPAAKDAQS